MRSLYFIVTLFFVYTNLKAQPFLVRDQSITLTKNASLLDLAWLGGLNNPQFSSIDFDEDGVNDVFVFDKSGNMIIPLIQVGSENQIELKFKPEYIKYFPVLKDWVLLRDFNCDGYQDIFTYSQFGPGAMVFENNGQVGMDWFSLADSLLYSYYELGSSTGDLNIFISTIDVPAIYDVDNDGDLDIFTYQLQGSKVEFHKNYSVENTSSCGLDYELKNRCWGYFAESEDSEEILLGQDCFNVVDPKFGDIKHHTGSTLLMLDINNDGFNELVMGDISYSSLTTVVNGGPSITGPDSITSVDYYFPNNNEELVLNNFPASFYVDVNNDNVKDLIVAPNAQYTSDNVKAVKLYINNGQDNNPNLELENAAFLQGDMIDVGEGAYPVFMDVNNDGLVDLLIGNRKRIVDSIINSSITYYQNIGSASNPAFEWQSDDIFDLSTLGMGEALYPTFMDLDGDNALDLVIGSLSGDLYYLINAANANQEMDFPGPAHVLDDNNNDAIDVGQLAKPQAFDINNDNLIDLLIGERSGRIYYFENTGSASSPDFTLISDALGDIQTPGYLGNTGYSSPFFYTEDGEVKLIIGSETGEIQYYDNISNNLNGSFNLTTGPASLFNEGKRTCVARLDINNDGLPDLFIGNYRGGISFFKGDLTNEVIEKEKLSFNVFPNPSDKNLSITFDNFGNKEIQIYSQLGKLLFSKSISETNTFQLNVEAWEAGQYIIRYSDQNTQQFTSFILIH
jgi:hypothetical protein